MAAPRPPQPSAGSVALKRAGHSRERISRDTGVSYQVAAKWLEGHRKPTAAMRPRLHALYGVSPVQWDEPPPVTERREISRSPDAPKHAGPEDVRDTAAGMLAQVQKELTTVATDPVLTPDERAKVYDKLARTLTTVAKITGAATDMPESKILKLPALRRVLDEILTALAPWPEAIRACAEAIARLEQ